MTSVIICSTDRARFERTAEGYRRALAGEEVELIGIADAKGIAEGYNRGFARSRGETIIFSHDDVEVLSEDFPDRLRGHLGNYDLVGIAGATRLLSGRWIAAGPPYIYGQVATPNPAEQVIDVYIWSNAARCVGGIKVLDGAFICAKRHVVQALGFDQQTFDGFHLYDVDFTFRAYLAGFKLAVCCDLPLLHESPGVFDERFGQYHELFMRKHGPRLDRGREPLFRVCAVKVQSREELRGVMTPPHWIYRGLTENPLPNPPPEYRGRE